MALSFCYPPHAPRAHAPARLPSPRDTSFLSDRLRCLLDSPSAASVPRQAVVILPRFAGTPAAAACCSLPASGQPLTTLSLFAATRPAKVLHFNELCSAPCQKARRRALFLVWYRHGWARRPSPLLQPEADFPCSLPEEKHDADLDDVKAIESTDPQWYSAFISYDEEVILRKWGVLPTLGVVYDEKMRFQTVTLLIFDFREDRTLVFFGVGK